MSRPEEYTLGPKAVIELARELLSTRGAPATMANMVELDYEEYPRPRAAGGGGPHSARRYRPVDVIAWCRKRQSRSMRYAFAVVAEVERVLEAKRRALDEHDNSDLQYLHIAAIDLLSDLLEAAKAAEGDES